MIRFPKLTAAALFALCLSAHPVMAQNDFGTWASIQAVKSIGSGGYAMARFEHRSYENASATESYFAMAGGGYNFCSWLKGDLSYEFWKLPSSGGATMHKGVACLTGTLRRDALAVILREKYEIAFREDATSTLRTRLRAQYRAESVPLTPYVMYEIFGGLSSSNAGWVRSLHYAGTEVRLGQHSTIDVFYMYNLYYPVSGGAASSAATGGSVGTAGRHVLGVGYVVAF